MEFTSFENMLMRRLLRLAAKQAGVSHPNPLVASAVVTREKVIGEGVHQNPGTPHAEILALQQAGAQANGATLYVTLEPCSHHGRTPPCVEAIIKAGISRVVYPIEDPNPLVRSSPSKTLLEKKGIRVDVGLLGTEAITTNEVYFKTMLTKLPFVKLKVAMSLDGKIAAESGESCYITSVKSRKMVQKHDWKDHHDNIF